MLAAMLALAAGTALHAATGTDPFANEPPNNTGISISRPAEPRAAPAPPPPGNPLWAIPLSALPQTQERPVFAPTRRPPPRAVVAAPVVAAPQAPPPPAPPEPLQLSLIGAVVGDGDAIAVFVDRATQGIVRMRTGQVHAGWSLTTIAPREATLTRGDQTETVAIQRGAGGVAPNAPVFSGSGTAPVASSPPPTAAPPAAANYGTQYTPALKP